MKRIRPTSSSKTGWYLTRPRTEWPKKKKKKVSLNPPLDSESCSICVTRATVGIFESLPVSF